VSPNHIHPDLRTAARAFPRRGVSARRLKAARALSHVPNIVPVRGVRAVSLGDGVTVRVHEPANMVTPSPAILWIHGGGYVIGTARFDDRFCRSLARATGIPIAAVDYRLSPEHPYPIPLEDCHRALRWLSGERWVDSTRVAIAGASAGGGLAAALALRARDRGDVIPALQMLIYPMLDDRTSDRRDIDETSFRFWGRAENRFGWNSYLGQADRDQAVPARQSVLSGVAPAWLGVGTADLFHDEGIAYAARLAAAGVPCDLDVVPGAFHGFDRFVPWARVSKRFVSNIQERLRLSLVLPDSTGAGT
jgi:acetyl esterase/lipase